jgi:hypothetical protein
MSTVRMDRMSKDISIWGRKFSHVCKRTQNVLVGTDLAKSPFSKLLVSYKQSSKICYYRPHTVS